MSRGQSWVDEITGETLIVNLKSETAALKGVVFPLGDDALVLRQVTILEGDAHTAVEGHVIVPRDNVDFCQRL